MLPTNLVCTMATMENIKLEAIEGAANCHMVGRVYSGVADSPSAANDGSVRASGRQAF
jgi:hypothetical protein